jgi:hypothetical protein
MRVEAYFGIDGRLLAIFGPNNALERAALRCGVLSADWRILAFDCIEPGLRVPLGGPSRGLIRPSV